MKIFDVLIWMSLGVILLLIQYGIWWYLKGKGKATIPLQLCGFLANFFLVFAMAWGYSSFKEHEYQAIAMGFIFFGGTALIPAIITYRLANLKAKATNKKSDTIAP
ncbi:MULTISPECIES: tetrachloroethene dehalogenase [unclassified Dehalobacter]|uniref:tetrachloroethene dehalogenase n=1 Tax=unclassified Dehalobacter TaxID=2635733 RepID=UPI000E6BA54E|nr:MULTISPECIES: tetrachloroethene dehalogenase [unclassified Dehalobacter]RJE48647.1 tetrachloroethene dehalogenase [Dehalobacter sp. MCB1]TCX47271.1 tetrachloroethene dehalogenase [Dehalobacter sp. 14DCB1]TCX55693.1 tetrachloroethene dehalogenase [Dehalobacter sp. 12DCB1]